MLVEIPIDDFEAFKNLDTNLYSELIVTTKQLNDLISRHNTLIKEKISNPFETMEYLSENIVTFYEKLNNIIDNIEKSRLDFNNAISDRDRLKEKLNELNDQIAYYDIKDDYRQ